jgi:outer membrane autotransporter protein
MPVRLEAGVALWRQTGRDGGRDDLGVYVGYAFADVDQVYSLARAGTVTMNAYSGRAYWTHFGPQGRYRDCALEGTWLRQVHGVANATGMTISSSGPTASIEARDPFRVAMSWTIEPQAQSIYPYIALSCGWDACG